MADAATLRKNFLWNTFGQITYLMCQFLCGIFVVRLAGTQQSGLYNVALTVTNIFLSLASYGMYSFQVSDASDKYSASCYIRSRMYTCSAAVLACAAYTGFYVLTGKYGPMQSVCIVLFLIYRMVESATDIYNAIDQKHERLDIVGKTYAMRGVSSLAVFILTLVATKSILLTLALMALANIALFAFYTLPKAAPFYSRQPVQGTAVKNLLYECLPLAAYSVLSTTTTSIPRLVLSNVCGEEALGIYNPVTQPVMLLQVCATYLFNPFITTFSVSYYENDRKRFYRAVINVQAILLAMLPAGLIVAQVLGRWGLAVFVGAGMEEYHALLAPMVVSAVLTATNLFYSMILTVMRSMKSLLAANLLGIVVAFFVSRPCVLQWEMQGATVAAIIAQLAQLTMLLICVMRQSHAHFRDGFTPKPEDPFDGLPN